MAGRAPGIMGGLSVTEKKGKFNVEEFDQLGLINGQAAQDVDLESIEDKPWKKPGKYSRWYFGLHLPSKFSYLKLLFHSFKFSSLNTYTMRYI